MGINHQLLDVGDDQGGRKRLENCILGNAEI